MGLNSACLAIDAGNTKTDVAVVATDGTVLGSARGGGFHPPVSGVDAAVEDLGRTVAQALTDAGADPAEPAAPAGRAPLAHVSACLANADLPREEREVTSVLAARRWGNTTHVANDTFAILRAGLPDDRSVTHGVAVVCGAGINCVGQHGDGRTHRFPALGLISGDFGGGGGLASEAIWHAARAEDGRGEPTQLARALPGHFGLPSMYALIEALHMGDLPGSRKHEITPLLFTVATAGDPVARALVHRQAEEIVSMVTVTLTRLGLLHTETPVILGGSVVAARHPLLHDHLVRELADVAPLAAPQIVTAPPVLGSALLGLDRAGSSPDAHARLRAYYA
ncbi:N-acetylglucosamine kinase [Streptomyces albidus (ex Kaewkla and Franco 2022)]|uniref:N-acetylglucosamine kinase n=1 Tax=Streptomyces albidus (ex Kaewkla and Franco 2022) TaxID=722709 RepID=UPI0015EF2D60|nr:BadF/BadG/BcrA/BcrD ATPase family protein [Streptomyces albidus (ex Kaewkla and Franco 2022)]